MPLAKFSIRRPVATLMFFSGVVLLGVLSLVRIPVNLLPDVAYPRLVVYTGNPGAAAPEVERFLTEPVEQAVSTVPGLRAVESVTREGLSLVTARFAWGTDMDFAALSVRERLDNLRGSLPVHASRPTVLRADPQSEPVMALAISGRADLASLHDVSQQLIRRRLEQIDGVALAEVTGGVEREIQVELDRSRLESYGLTLADVAQAVEAANATAPGGSVLRGQYRYSLRTLGDFQSVPEIARVPIALKRDTTDDRLGQVMVGDVARVTDGFRDREAIARYNGAQAVGVLVYKDAGANTVNVAEQVRRVLADLEEQHPEIRLDVAMDQAEFVADALANVVQDVVLGGILAVLVLFLFLREWRSPLAIGLSIPISLAATFALMDAVGASLNLLSLGGLALGIGMLMDNSIVVLENISRHRERGLAPAAAAALGAEEVQRAITASTLTTIAVFGPIAYIEGVAGELLGALALSVAFSLLASIAVATTLLPTLTARWGGRGMQSAGSPGEGRVAGAVRGILDGFERRFTRFGAWHGRLLASAMQHRGRTLGVAAGLLAAGIALGASLERSVLPEVDQGAFRMRLILPPGTPLDRTSDLAARLERLVSGDGSVEAVFAQVGRRAAFAGMDNRESGPHTAVVDVRLREGAVTRELLARLRPQLSSFPPGSVTIETGGVAALGRMLGTGEADITVRVRGDDTEAALAFARDAGAALSRVPALSGVQVGNAAGQPEVLVEVDREKAARFGVEPRAITDAVQAHMRGAVATSFNAFDQKIPVVVRLPEHERRSLETLSLIQVRGVPVRELVSLRTVHGPLEIRRLGQSRVTTVNADVVRGTVEDAVPQIRAALAPLPVPPGLRVDIGGEHQEMRSGFRDLGFAFLLAVLLVYMLLAAEFESLVQPVIVLVAVPLSLVGAFFALWASGIGINTMSVIGLVILVGIVDNDAVVKIDFINQMRAKGLSRAEAIRAAGHARLRPIVMNSITAALGLLPLAMGTGPGAELQAPLAVAVFGGLISATALTLVVVPVTYDVLEEAGERFRRWMAAPPGAVEGPSDPQPVSAD